MKLFYSLWAKLTGRNLKSTPPDLIVDQMNEPRPLPLGRTEFDEWADRIIAGAMVQGGEENPEAFLEGQKYAIATMIMHLGPTESHKPDAYFIHSLRKGAANQVAHAVMQELNKKAKERTAAEEAKKASDEAKQG